MNRRLVALANFCFQEKADLSERMLATRTLELLLVVGSPLKLKANGPYGHSAARAERAAISHRDR